MRVLLAYLRGEPRVCSMVHGPSPEQEDAKRPVRERERLIRERGAHTNRIKALLHGQGIGEVAPRRPDFADHLAGMRPGDGRPLPPKLVLARVFWCARCSTVGLTIAVRWAATSA